MVLSININELDKKVQCAICLDTVCNPKSLTCQHSYCKRCLDNLLQFNNNGSASIKCPKGCAIETQISSTETTNNLPINYMLKDIVAATNWKGKYSRKLTCTSCTRDIKRYCVQCKVFKCEQCADRHNTNCFVPVAFQPGRSHRGKVVIVCNKHATEATYVCCDDKFVCIYCVQRGHKQSPYWGAAKHNHVMLDGMEATLKEALNEKVNSNKDHCARRADANKDVLDVKRKLHNALQVNKLRCLKDYMEHLDKEETRIIHKVGLLCTKYMDSLDSISYFQECMSKKGVDFILQRNEILKKLKYFDKTNTIEDVAVTLCNRNFDDPQPLGSISVLSEEHVSDSGLSRRSFRCTMNNQYASSASLSSLQSMRNMLQQLPDESSDDDDDDRKDGAITFEVKNASQIEKKVFSESVTIRKLPWCIMFKPFVEEDGEKKKSVGIFVGCKPKGKGSLWSCKARVEITMKNRIIKTGIKKNYDEVFNTKSNSRGYTSFIPWDDMINPNKGYSDNDSITIKASIEAEVPRGVGWDSKEITGYVGLTNNNGNSYLNSMMQILFSTNKLRKEVFNVPAEHGIDMVTILQRVFYGLQWANM